MADDLFSIKNEFYLGNYGGAINEAQSGDLELSSANDERDRDVIVRVHARAPPAPGARHSSSYYCSRCAQDRPAYFRLPPLSDLPGSQAQTSPTACAKDDAETCDACTALCRSTGHTLRKASTISCRTRSRTMPRLPSRP